MVKRVSKLKRRRGSGRRTLRNSRMSATKGHITSSHQAGPCSIALFFPNRFSSARAVLISPLSFFVPPTGALGPPLLAPGVAAGVTVGVATPLSTSSGGVSYSSAFVGK